MEFCSLSDIPKTVLIIQSSLKELSEGFTIFLSYYDYTGSHACRYIRKNYRFDNLDTNNSFSVNINKTKNINEYHVTWSNTKFNCSLGLQGMKFTCKDSDVDAILVMALAKIIPDITGTV